MAQIAECEGCRAEIIWTITAKGRRMPVDAKPIQGFVLIEKEGETPKALTGRVHLSHFATCPQAKRFRKEG